MSKQQKRSEHRLEFAKKIGRMRCARCGELKLKNEASRTALKKPCPNDLWNEKDDG